MSDIPAQIAAELNDLRQRLATSETARDAAEARSAASELQLAEANKTIAGDATVRARVAELEALLADPPEGSGVQLVHYLDTNGTMLKKRFRSSDGSKFKLLPDAVRQEAKVALIGMGLTDTAAETVIERGDVILQRLHALKA